MATGEEIRKFWAQTRAALSKVDMDARVEPVESSDPFVMEGGIKTRTASRVILSSFEARRIRAWYTCRRATRQREAGRLFWRCRAMAAFCRCPSTWCSMAMPR